MNRSSRIIIVILLVIVLGGCGLKSVSNDADGAKGRQQSEGIQMGSAEAVKKPLQPKKVIWDTQVAFFVLK